MTDNAQNDITHRILRHVADNGDNPVLRELATDVLRGNITLADGMAFSTYAEALAEGLDGFTQWYEGLSDDERAKEAGSCADELKKLEDHLTADNPTG